MGPSSRSRPGSSTPANTLALRHKAGRLKTDFKHALGTIAYHVPCHQRVQNMDPKTAEVLGLVPGTSIERIERAGLCAGIDHATYRHALEPIPSQIRDALLADLD